MPPTAVVDDGSNRQIIADRYRRLPGMRRNIKRSAVVQLAYICVRTLWHSVPYLTGEDPLTASTEWIFYAAVALFLLRPWAFGFGRAQRERLTAIMLYSVGGMLLMAEILIIFYQYYIDWGMMGRKQEWQYPQMLAKHWAPRLGWSVASVVTAGQWFERAMDTVGIAATLINVYITKEYVLEMKEDKKDKAELAAGKQN